MKASSALPVWGACQLERVLLDPAPSLPLGAEFMGEDVFVA